MKVSYSRQHPFGNKFRHKKRLNWLFAVPDQARFEAKLPYGGTHDTIINKCSKEFVTNVDLLHPFYFLVTRREVSNPEGGSQGGNALWKWVKLKMITETGVMSSPENTCSFSPFSFSEWRSTKGGHENLSHSGESTTSIRKSPRGCLCDDNPLF